MSEIILKDLKSILSKLVINGEQIDITDEMRLKEDLGLDSLLVVSLILDIEDDMKIRFDESDLDPKELITVKDLAKLIESTQKRGN